MPWKECSVMDERVRFVGRLLDGEGMSAVCRSFGISRKTGYEIFNPLKKDGVHALWLARISQCAQMARITSGGRIHPEKSR